MRRKSVEATKDLKNDLKRRTESLVVSGGTLDRGGQKDVQKQPDAECDNFIRALTLVTHVMKGNKCGGEHRPAHALGAVHCGGQRKIVWSPWMSWRSSCKDLLCRNFNKGIYAHTYVVEGEVVLTLRPEEQRSQKAFVDTSRTPKEIRRPLLMEDWIVAMSGAVSVDQGGRVDRNAPTVQGSPQEDCRH